MKISIKSAKALKKKKKFIGASGLVERILLSLG